MTDRLCPLCLSEFPAGTVGADCPSCRADGKPVRLMLRGAYLAAVDFAVVEAFWAAAPPERAEVARRVLDRADRLKTAQAREFGRAVVLAT